MVLPFLANIFVQRARRHRSVPAAHILLRVPTTPDCSPSGSNQFALHSKVAGYSAPEIPQSTFGSAELLRPPNRSRKIKFHIRDSPAGKNSESFHTTQNPRRALASKHSLAGYMNRTPWRVLSKKIAPPPALQPRNTPSARR